MERYKTAQRRRRAKLEELFNQDTNCRNCGCVTVLPIKFKEYPKGYIFPDNMATLQHHLDKQSGLREKSWNTQDVDLWCYACNQKDAVDLSKMYRLIESRLNGSDTH